MKARHILRLAAGFSVAMVMALTGLVAYHMSVRPLGVLVKMLPHEGGGAHKASEEDVTHILEAADMPDIDPGEQAYQTAHEMVAMGKLVDAREKLAFLVNAYPASSSAPAARGILGEMNLDDLFSPANKQGRQTHSVKAGDSYFAIANKYQTTLDMIMEINQMTELANLVPGDEILVMPLNFRLLLEPKRKAISLWDGDSFVREYVAQQWDVPVRLPSQKTTIEGRTASLAGKRVQPQQKEYRGAEKTIQLANFSYVIRAEGSVQTTNGKSIFLRATDMEELVLLTRSGNLVEIRNLVR